ncbi:MAG TPA: rhodanese-like domain-containing protein [Planctomycetota bacterium]|nr:rhodanese-like domain-containing protein [Planctomycetota bacterium]
MNRRYSCIAGILICCATSCGRDKFAQELDFEKAAVPLVREVQDGGYSVISTKELYDRVQTGERSWLLIDAMPEDSYSAGHIESAVHFLFPKDTMANWDAAETGGKSEADYRALLGDDLARPIIIYCGYATCLRSHNAAMWARRFGYQNVFRHPGGLFAWKGAGYPLVTKKP